MNLADLLQQLAPDLMGGDSGGLAGSAGGAQAPTPPQAGGGVMPPQAGGGVMPPVQGFDAQNPTANVPLPPSRPAGAPLPPTQPYTQGGQTGSSLQAANAPPPTPLGNPMGEIGNDAPGNTPIQTAPPVPPPAAPAGPMAAPPQNGAIPLPQPRPPGAPHAGGVPLPPPRPPQAPVAPRRFRPTLPRQPGHSRPRPRRLPCRRSPRVTPIASIGPPPPALQPRKSEFLGLSPPRPSRVSAPASRPRPRARMDRRLRRSLPASAGRSRAARTRPTTSRRSAWPRRRSTSTRCRPASKDTLAAMAQGNTQQYREAQAKYLSARADALTKNGGSGSGAYQRTPQYQILTIDKAVDTKLAQDLRPASSQWEQNGTPPAQQKAEEQAIRQGAETERQSRYQKLGLDPNAAQRLKTEGLSKDNPMDTTHMSAQDFHSQVPMGAWYMTQDGESLSAHLRHRRARARTRRRPMSRTRKATDGPRAEGSR